MKAILAPLPKDKEGRIKIDDFLHTDIHSPQAFKVRKNNESSANKFRESLTGLSLDLASNNYFELYLAVVMTNSLYTIEQ